jgi:uncharacterized membrane-anchored protein
VNRISVETQGSIDPSLEAYWSSDEFELYFSYDPVGYVQMDDWDELDVDELWKSYLEGAKEQSPKYGHEVRPLGWVIRPTLDRVNSVAYYAVEAQFGEDPPVVNTIIYDFGRHGYEEITPVQGSADFPADHANSIANRIADAYEFGAGSRYQDFRPGDTVAAVGAGGLIAAALGAKFGKSLLVLAIVFLKKLWFMVLFIPIALWNFVRTRLS